MTTKLEIWTLVEVNAGTVSPPHSFLNHKQAEQAYIDRANELYDNYNEKGEDQDFISVEEVNEYQMYSELDYDLTLFYDEILVVYNHA